ncbi:low-affinity phosphate transporter [Malassezia cuniculi]|uniref:Low-affinity phosphate transporter n=1 Tax=Malassezia cuniculi TaxID=948313 RepID=A0AAF0J4X0_9BASI|nr:low-affinity phosphate transporter [Malassezia cuniculi]
MKFSHSLQLNSVPEWRDKYIDYQHLKKVVYELEREQVAAQDPNSETLESESRVLLSNGDSNTDHVFVPQLDRELRKIVDFYCAKERELVDETNVVRDHMRLAEEEFEMHYSEGSDADVSNDDEDESRSIHKRPSHNHLSADGPTSHQWLRTFGKKGNFRRLRRHSSSSTLEACAADISHDSSYRHSVWSAPDEYAVDLRLTIKRQLNELFTHLSELAQYVDINETGMKKIIKKYDKITHSHLLGRYVDQVVHAKYPFQARAKQQRDTCIADVITMYACVATRGDEKQAERQLKAQLREEVVWQRNTVWREMINIERRAQAATLEASLRPGGSEQPSQQVHTPWGDFGLPVLAAVQLAVSVGIFVALLKLPALRFFSSVEEQNCLALVVFCTCLWVTEVIPLFSTSLLVPFLIVTLRIARVEDKHGGRRLTAQETSRWIFEQMFAPNIALLLGGFTLAAALSKYGIDKVLATRVLRLAGTRPSIVLLAHMMVACFASMWVSNVAAPVLMFSLVQPILRTLPDRSPYATSLVMGIALASNIGGQTSPIASPQNLIALQYMEEPLGWLQWFTITIPVSGLSLFAIWIILLWAFGSGKGTVIRRIPEPSEPLSRTQWFISSVCVGTIILWCLEKKFEWIVGDMGVIALLPLVLFFGTGILTKEDFNNFLWTIVFLAMGGIALGKGVSSSGLLASMDKLVQGLVQGMSIWGILALLLAIGLVVATFISHTIAAVLLIPIAAQMGESLSPPQPRLLIMATALTASAAMGLPISGFPNMTAVSLEDEVGHRYVSVKTFLRVGVPASIVSTFIIGTLGYVIMSMLGL